MVGGDSSSRGSSNEAQGGRQKRFNRGERENVDAGQKWVQEIDGRERRRTRKRTETEQNPENNNEIRISDGAEGVMHQR